MDHTHIIRALDLQRYADTQDSEKVIPELIYQLVKQSVSNLSLCRIPYGEAVNQAGWDGLVHAEEAFFKFVPEGESYWEIGTGSNPQGKATTDFKKRTKILSESDRAKATFVLSLLGPPVSVDGPSQNRRSGKKAEKATGGN